MEIHSNKGYMLVVIIYIKQPTSYSNGKICKDMSSGKRD